MKPTKNNNMTQNEEDIELHDAFMQFHQKFVACLRKEAEDAKFSMSQLEILRFVMLKENPTMKDIAVHLNITAPSATSLIEHLFNKKLVTRKMDPKDRRGIRICPTKKALKLFSVFKDIKAGIFAKILLPLTRNDKKQLATILKKLI
jgi:DNA-binding MarR family transcriptional regulator